jgi:hypothetical protein
MLKLSHKRGHDYYCYIPTGSVAPPPPPPPPPPPVDPVEPVFNENEEQLLGDLLAALVAFQPQKAASDLALDNLREQIEREQMDYLQEHLFRLTETGWLLNLLMESHVATMNALISEEIALDVRSNLIRYRLNTIYAMEDELVYNVAHEVYGLRTDIGDLWARFVTEHESLKGLIDSLPPEDRPTGDDTYDPEENQTDSSTVRAGMQDIIDAFLQRITALVDEAHAKVQELEAMFPVENLEPAFQDAYRRSQTNMDYTELYRYTGLVSDYWDEMIPSMNTFMNNFAPFNLAERNALKPLYNEEDILVTIFNNRDLIPPAQTGSRFATAHGRLKVIIDGTPT